jgi:hypothetical protein
VDQLLRVWFGGRSDAAEETAAAGTAACWPGHCRWARALLRKCSETLASGASEIVLQAGDWEELAQTDPPPLPDAFAVMVAVAAASTSALARGDFQVLLHGASGPSGARLLGRFCHADAELRQLVQQHVQAEEALQPEAVFAEIVHLPEGRLGNILARPVLRSYEIPYLGTAGVPADRQIPVTDLRVRVEGGRIVLRSARLNRRVLPRLTSAHNFHAGRGIYRFLCALQSQGTAGELAATCTCTPTACCARRSAPRSWSCTTSSPVSRSRVLPGPLGDDTSDVGRTGALSPPGAAAEIINFALMMAKRREYLRRCPVLERLRFNEAGKRLFSGKEIR